MTNKKLILGIFLFLIGIILIVSSQTGITGNVISETASAFGNIFGLVFVVVGILLMGESLENIVDHREASTPQAREKLRERLKDMQNKNLPGFIESKPEGRSLSYNEINDVKDTILKYIPKELVSNNSVEISLTGSLSSRKKGKRKGYRWGQRDIPSDKFYLSDVDINIVGKDPFDYVKANWDDAIMIGRGKKSGRETYNLTTNKYLKNEDLNRGYMKNAPHWIKDMLYELADKNLAGEKRPISIKFYKNRRAAGNVKRDVLYKIK